MLYIMGSATFIYKIQKINLIDCTPIVVELSKNIFFTE